MQNNKFRKFIASIGVAAMVTSTLTSAVQPVVIYAENSEEENAAEASQNTAPDPAGEPAEQSADGEQAGVAAVSEEDGAENAAVMEESAPEAAEASEGNPEEENASQEEVTAPDEEASESGNSGNEAAQEKNAPESGSEAGQSEGGSPEENPDADQKENRDAGEEDSREDSPKEITSVLTEDIDLGTYTTDDAPAYAELKLPKEIDVKVDEEKETVTVTWNGEESYHNTEAGTYTFTSELDKDWNKDEDGEARYQLADKVELPKAIITVTKAPEQAEPSKDTKEPEKDGRKDTAADTKQEETAKDKTAADDKTATGDKSSDKTGDRKDAQKDTKKDELKKDKAGEEEDRKNDSKKDAAAKDLSDAAEDNKKDEKSETVEEPGTEKKEVTREASLKAVYETEDGTILCGAVNLSGDSIALSDKAKTFNGYVLQSITLDGAMLSEDTVFTKDVETTETKEETVTKTSYTYTVNGEENQVAAGDTAEITYTYAQKEEITPIEVTGAAVDTTGAAIQGDYVFNLAIGTNDLVKVAPYIQGYEYQYAEIGTGKITSIDKEVIEAGQYAYYVDGTLLKGNTKITYVYQEDEDYTEQLTGTCGNLTVTVSATKDAKIPEGTKVSVSPIESARMSQIMAKVSETLGQDPENVTGVLYDISLDRDGESIQPKESVHVTMKFDGGIPWNVPEGKQIADTSVVHMHGGETEVVAEDTGDGNAEFETESFSTYGMIAMYADGGQNIDSIDLKDALQNISISTVVVNEKEETFDPNKEYPRDAKFKFTLNYAFSEGNKPTASGVRKATYTLPDGLDISDTNGYIDCEGYTAGHAGSYTIKNGVITFEYEKDFLVKHPNNIKGSFHFSSKLSEGKTRNIESVTIEFPGEGKTIPITIKLEEGKITGKKKYQLNNDGTIDFSIEMEVKGKDVENVTLTDTQGSNLAFSEDPQFKLDGTTIDESKIKKQGDNAVEIELGNMSVGTHILTYKAKLKNKDIISGEHNKNTATWNWNGKKSDHTETTVQAVKKSLQKTGKADDGSENEITWTIIYVPGDLGTVAGKTFTDTLGSDQRYTGQYKVYYDPYGNQYWADGKIIDEGNMPTEGNFNYTFKPDQTASKGAYKLVYKTKVTKDLSGSMGKETFTNTASVDGETATGAAEIDNSPDIVSKIGQADDDSRTASWTVTVTPPSGKTLNNLVVVDELQDNSNWKGKYIETGIVIKENNEALNAGTDYNIAFDNDNAKMTVTFKKSITGVVTIEYRTDYSGSEETGCTSNKAHSSYYVDGVEHKEDDSASAEFKKKLAVNKTGSLSGGVASWKVSINEREGWKRAALQNGILNDIVDTIPAGMEYVEGSLKCAIDKSHWGEEKTEEYQDVTANFNQKSRELHISINNLDYSQDPYIYVELEYKTRVTSIPAETGNGTTVANDKISFTNKVSVGGKEDSATVDMSSRELDKKGQQVEGLNVIEYTIVVNGSAEKLNSEGNTLELTDTLDPNLTLDTTSIKVTDMFDSNANVDYQCSFGTASDGSNIMTLTLPDERALVVTYRASLILAGKNAGTIYNVSNKATLVGSRIKTVEQTSGVKYEKSDASVEGNLNSIKIQKVDEKGLPLKGATFIVQKVNPITLEPDGDQITINTDDKGMAVFENLELNQLYYYKETDAPKGYKITDDNKHYFIIKNLKDDAEKIYEKLIESVKGRITYTELSGGQTFIVVNQPEKISVGGTKTWDDGNNQDGKRPGKITVNLLANGEKVKSQDVVPSAEGNWTYKFTGLPKYKDGNEIVYTVTEDAVPDYTTTVDGYNITNSYTPGKTSVTVTKAWDDANNQDGLRPESVQVQLYADGKSYGKPVTLNADNNWYYTWTGLDEKKAGTSIAYTVAEVDIPEGYTTSAVTGNASEGYVITNNHTPETTEVSGEKTWNDADNQDGKQPKSITVRVLADGTEVASKEVTAADGWKYKFEKLPKKANGKEIVYTVTEDAVPDYTTTVDGYNITNSYTPGKTSVTVTKAWDDANNQDGLRPEKVKVQLYADGKPLGQAVTLTAEENWTHTWSELPEKKAGKTIEYTVQEIGEVKGYTATVTGTAKEGYTVKNSHTPETTEVGGTKIWDDGNNQDGKRPGKITVNLLANGEKVKSQDVVPSAEGNWTYKFTGLPKYKDGNEIVYTVTEDAVPDYTTTVDGYNITNSYTPGKTSVTVTKAWDDANNRDNKRPDSITVNLFADGTKVQSQKITAADGWKYEFRDLPKYSNGKEIKYTISEDSVKNYTTSIDGYKITNTYTPETVQVAGSKNWNDNGNAVGLRPESITIRLYANGKEMDHKTVTEKDGWSWNWKDLKRYDTDHQEISYTISEDAVNGYTTEVNGFNVTNTVIWQSGSVILTKTDAYTGKALAGADFDLYRIGGAKVGSYTTNAAGVLWVDGLALGDYYFVETKAPDGYVLDSRQIGFRITTETTAAAPVTVSMTNKPVEEKIGVSAVKVWDDEDNTDGVRPSSVTFRLLANGVEIGSGTASAENGWSVSFGELPKTKNGADIHYTIVEDAVGNYYETSYETGVGADGSIAFTVKNYRETDRHYEERTGSVRGANRNRPSNGGGVAGAGRGRGTGDDGNMMVYGGVSGASLLALIVWMIARRKRRGHQG